jgi:hypothetical protein
VQAGLQHKGVRKGGPTPDSALLAAMPDDLDAD